MYCTSRLIVFLVFVLVSLLSVQHNGRFSPVIILLTLLCD